MNNICILTWGHYLLPVENYGAKIKHFKNYVSYSSPLLPPGTNVYTWDSCSIFQNTRSQGTLPMLKANNIYMLTGKVRAVPKNSFYIKVITYNDLGEVDHEFNLGSQGGEFLYPKTARSYRVSLITKANKSISFEWLAIGLVNHFSKGCIEVYDDFSTFISRKSKNFHIYLLRRGSESWSMPVEGNDSTIVLRLTDEEIETPLSSNLFDSVCKRFNLADCNVNIKSNGYPLRKAVNAYKEKFGIVKGD